MRVEKRYPTSTHQHISIRPEGVADGANSDQDSVPALGTMRRRGRMGGMSRATSMPNVMLAANGLSKSPSPPATMVFPKLEVPISSDSLLPTATSAPLGMPRSLSSGCLLSAANGAPFPIPTTPINAPPAPPLSGNPNSFLSAQAVMAAPSTVPAGVGPPTAVWHAQMGLTPRRKGKGGRQPANDPRLDPTVDPKKARRIVANRISAAKSKLKQKSEIEVLKAQLSEMTAQRDTLQQQTDAMQRHCQGLEDHNKQLQSTVQILQEMQQVQEAMTKKLQAELASLRGDKAPREQDSDHTTGSDSTHHRAELGERRAAMEP